METEIVASAAISRDSVEHRGMVVNTTKYGTDEERENVTDVGKVTAHLKGIGLSARSGISNHDSGSVATPSLDWKSASGSNRNGTSRLAESDVVSAGSQETKILYSTE